ncbi:polysaccharide deacetylase family protein [Clostridium sp. WILCCON 0269]|uniref:Polysaccharide deacetylase family protein n=1 Tax=Candidatus Clostridium eludens TaxID=3381663 RepID=A0ABW8SLZ8_9CLOT
MKIKNFLLTIICILYFTLYYTIPIKAFSQTSFSAKNDLNTSSDNKVIYLTFDDGPSTVVTGRILDILKQENIKATFFIIGYKIEGREDLLKRMNDEGHSIGLHTYTHKCNVIYSNENSFLDEMARTENQVKSILGFDPKIIRFPTGSKNHLNASLLEKLHSSGYKIYDWNLSLSDGINYKTPVNKLFNEATKKCVNPNKIFLLAHCDATNENTCKVLPEIIKYYKDLGYEFKAITKDTPEYHFRVPK